MLEAAHSVSGVWNLSAKKFHTKVVSDWEAFAVKAKALALFVGLSLATTHPAAALLITATGSGSDGPLAASADFTFGNGTLTD
jgi:hypothetical protein